MLNVMSMSAKNINALDARRVNMKPQNFFLIIPIPAINDANAIYMSAGMNACSNFIYHSFSRTCTVPVVRKFIQYIIVTKLVSIRKNDSIFKVLTVTHL